MTHFYEIQLFTKSFWNNETVDGRQLVYDVSKTQIFTENSFFPTNLISDTIKQNSPDWVLFFPELP